MKTSLLSTAALCFSLSLTSNLSGQQTASISSLFDQLSSEETTDRAVEQFMKLGPNNTDAKAYLANRLPAAIAVEPKDHPHSWVNEVRLAGVFRITEAMPSLEKWIGMVVGSPSGSTLAERVRLDSFPAGKALSQIGEPAVPTLARTLETGNPRERWVAYRALVMIGTPHARAALSDHLDHESDPTIKLEIQRAIEPGGRVGQP
jgi:HEAT repeats